MVRLIVGTTKVGFYDEKGFQFQNGSINSFPRYRIRVAFSKFQFQNGSINRRSEKVVLLIVTTFQFQNGSINR